MDIQKISYNPKDGRVLLRWFRYGKGVPDRHELESSDEPHPDFTDALRALAPVVAEACEVIGDGGEFLPEELEIRGLTLKDTADASGEMVPGVTITALRALDWSNGPLILNTPHAAIDALPSADAERLIEAAVSEASAYINGKRLQSDLFEQD